MANRRRRKGAEGTEEVGNVGSALLALEWFCNGATILQHFFKEKDCLLLLFLPLPFDFLLRIVFPFLLSSLS